MTTQLNLPLPRTAKQQQLNDFIKGYIATALWLAKPDDELNEWRAKDISADALSLISSDCLAFYTTARDLLLATGQSDFTHHGHDFYLTRNGHGSGYWDRGYPENIGDMLTELAGAYSPADLYRGDDNSLYYLNI